MKTSSDGGWSPVGLSGPAETGIRLRPRVLVVDDHEDTRHMYAWCLRAAGWYVEEAADGLEALQRALLASPDAIVLDLGLPVLDGVQTIRSLKGEAATHAVPIVVCTGARDGTSAARSAGCDAVLEKPCPPEIVCEIVDSVVRRR